MDPGVPLQHAMRATALQALRDADVILHLVEASEHGSGSLTDLAGRPGRRAPVLVARTKVDLLTAQQRHAPGSRVAGSDPVSALRATASTSSRAARRVTAGRTVPVSEDDVGTQHLRFFAAELVRETTLEQLSDEIPHAIACSIEEFREDKNPVYIRAIVYVERDSQKRIVIGHEGARIREIGRAARLKIEELVGSPVYLDLWVKVLPNWRRDREALRRLGYVLPGAGFMTAVPAVARHSGVSQVQGRPRVSSGSRSSTAGTAVSAIRSAMTSPSC